MEKQLVEQHNNQVVTTSIKVAKDFGKTHKTILRKIENILKSPVAQKCSTEFSKYFAKGTYKNSQNHSYPIYYMNKTGFSLVANGLTGSKALEFRLKYIHAFNRMEEIIKDNHLDSYMIDDPVKRAKKWLQEYQRTAKLEQENKVLKPKALFADSVSTSKDTILVRELAKLLKQNGIQVGEVRLFAWLRNHGYLIKRKGSDYNTPTQKSMEMGLFRVKEFIHTDGIGTVKITKTPKVTGKGQQYFINKLTNQMKVSEK